MTPARRGWERVYALVKRIPRGQVITYGQLAGMLRLRGGARAAGYAMAACPAGRGIPWHRVLGQGGAIRVREPAASRQRKLLETEGTPFRGMRVDLAACQWIPRRSQPAKKRRKKLKVVSHRVRGM